jgi:excisionase family DNA binding protein
VTPADRNDLPPLLRVPDLAAVLGMTANGVRALIARGELPAGKLGRQWIVRRDALLARLRTLERSRPAPMDPGEVLRAMTAPRRSGRPNPSDKHDALRIASLAAEIPASFAAHPTEH